MPSRVEQGRIGPRRTIERTGHRAGGEAAPASELQPLRARSRALRLCLVAGLVLLALACASPARGLGFDPPEPLQAQRGPGGYPDTVFEHIDQKNGLASPAVQAFAVDGQGFLWVGTQSGVGRWDGYHFRNYQMQLGVPRTLPDNMVRSLYTDPHGVLWIGTSSGGIARYNAATDDFDTFLPGGRDRTYPSVWTITSDGARGLWLGTGGGLDHFDIDTGRFTHTPFADTAAEPHIIALLREADGHIWAGTTLGLFRSDEHSEHFARIPFPQHDSSSVESLLRSSDGRLWVGTSHGVFVFNAASLTPQPVHETVAGPSPLANETVTAMEEVEPGILWLGTYGQGIVALDSGTMETHRILHDPAIATSLSEDSLSAIFRDRAGTVWLATLRGVDHTDITRKGVWTFYGGPSGKSDGRSVARPRIADTDILSLLSRPDGSLWLGLNSRGLEVFDRSGEVRSLLRPASTQLRSPLPAGMVEGFAAAPDGSVYLGTREGVFHADPAGKHITAVPMDHKAPAGVYNILYEAGKLWVGTDDGAWKLDVSPGSHTDHGFHLPLPSVRVTALAREGNNLWIGTTSDLYRYDVIANSVERIAPDPADPTALTAPVSSLLIDHSGRLWATTFGGGIVVLEGRDARGHRTFRRLLKGLPSANTDKLLLGLDGTIWASTDDGLAIIDPKTFAIRPLRQAEGVAISTYWSDSGDVSPDGRVLFGGVGGITILQPNLLRRWTYIPPVVVTDLRIGGKPLPWGQFNTPSRTAPLTIEPDQNSLAVEFAALDYTAPDQNQYAYRLDGFDPDWVTSDPTRRLANYTNLPPGNYTLELRGSNRDGLWGATRRIGVHVVPPWYQTLTAHVGMFVLLLVLMSAGFRIGTAYLRLRQYELERQVARRTAELEQITAELTKSQQQLELMAYSDSLTGLPNRRMFTEYFRRLIALKRRQHGRFVLLVIDLDDFKLVNDTHGHDAGDALLQEVARRLERMVRESDCFARMGGDEFTMLLAELADEESIAQVCEKIAESLRPPLLFGDVELATRTSIGVAIYPDSGESQDSLYKAADMALYRVKRQGGSGWHLFGTSDDELGDDRLPEDAAHVKSTD